MDKRFLGVLGGIVIIFIIIFAVTQNSGKGTSSNNNSSGSQPTHHVEGQGKSGVTLVEYGDYECPICEAYYQPLKAAVTPLLPQIYFQFRNLPLTSIHPNAFAGARAAEAAGIQGKYWQMHDKLYDNQNTWASSSNPQTYFDSYAKQIGLNVTQFDNDYSSDRVNNAINADINAFLNTSYANHDTNKEATPTFFLNGKYLSNSELVDQNGEPTSAAITNVLKAAIAKKS